MCGCRRSKPSNLERFSEDARSPWRLDDKRGRHSDAIHCHLSVYHQFLFNPLHGSLGRAPTHPPPSATLSGAREEAGGFVCANCIVRAKVLALGCLIWGLY